MSLTKFYKILNAHYENLPIQRIFQKQKLKISLEKFDISKIFAQNIHCGYTSAVRQL